MKKIYYLLLLLPLAFTACQKQPDVAVPTLTKTAALTLTLAPADYQLLPKTDYPYTTLSFNSKSDANLYIPMILAAKESSRLNSKSTAAVTYTLAAPTVQVADSLYNDITYTVQSSEYKPITGNNFGDFTAANVLSYLAAKYPNPVPNQLVVLTYVLFTTSDATVTNSFLYINGAWKKIYQVTPAEYTLVGEGKFDQMEAADVPNLPGDFNFFLKNDITIADTAKAGDVEYVSYAYFASKTAYQKVMALTYDGSNWGVITTQATGNFLLTNGAWAAVLPVPTINHTLNAADIAIIVASSDGTAAQRTNLGQYGDFSGWSTASLDAAFILVLQADYPTPVVGDNYNVIYLNYTGVDTPTGILFHYTGTAWVAN